MGAVFMSFSWLCRIIECRTGCDLPSGGSSGKIAFQLDVDCATAIMGLRKKHYRPAGKKFKEIENKGAGSVGEREPEPTPRDGVSHSP